MTDSVSDSQNRMILAEYPSTSTTKSKPAKVQTAIPDNPKAKKAKKRGKVKKAKEQSLHKENRPVDPSKPLSNTCHEKILQGVFSGMSYKDAYISAGYTATGNNAAAAVSHIASSDKFLARLEWLNTQAATKKVATKARALEILTEMLETRHSDFLTMSADGVWMHNIGPETLKQAGLVKVKTRIQTEKGSGNAVYEKQFDEIELERKVPVIERMAKMLGWDTPEKHELEADDVLKRYIAQVQSKKVVWIRRKSVKNNLPG